MRKSHRGSTIGRDGGQSRGCPSIDHGVQKFEGEGVKKYRNVIEKSYGSNTGNPAKEIKRASERKPKQEVIKALRLGKSEGLELQPRKGKANMRMELPKRRAPGGRVNREEANRITEELNASTSVYKGYEPKAPPMVTREIRGAKLAAKKPSHVSTERPISAARYLKGETSPLKREMHKVAPSHPDRQERKEEAIISREPSTHEMWKERYGLKPMAMHAPSFEELTEHLRTHNYKKRARGGHEKDLSFSEWAKEEKREHAHKPKKHRSGGRAHFDPHDFERDAEVPEERMAKTNLHTPHGRKKPYVNRTPSQDERDLSACIHEKKRHTHEKELRTGGRAAGGHWIQGAIKHPGALHKTLGVPQGTKIPRKKLLKAEHSSNPLTRKRANLAMTLKGFHKK